MYFFLIANLFGIVVALFLGIFVYTRDSYNKLNRLFLFNTLVAVYTGLAEFLRLSAVDQSWAVIFHKASFLWPLFPVIYLKFVLVFSENRLNSNKIFNTFLWGIAALFALLHIFTETFFNILVHQWYGWEAEKANSPFFSIILVFFAGLLFFSLFTILRFLLWPKIIKNKKQSLLMYCHFTLRH